MTIQQFSIKKIAIIGAGPGGLALLNELLHTDANGSSTIDEHDQPAHKLPENPAFEEIVVFEQSDTFGGAWRTPQEPGPGFPQSSANYYDPDGVRPKLKSPEAKSLENSSVKDPVSQKLSAPAAEGLLWYQSAMYEDLYTNVPNALMRFSAGASKKDAVDNIYRPFAHHSEIDSYIRKFVADNKLEPYIRFKTSVEKVVKKGDKWELTLVQLDFENGTEKWYTEEFDGVISAIGRVNIPFYPYVENLSQFAKEHPNTVLHSKSFRIRDISSDSKVLVVGGNVSAVDILQYLVPTAKEVHVSLTSKEAAAKKDGWVKDILQDERLAIHKHPKIKRFTDKGVEFEDGTEDHSFDKIIFATGYHIHYSFLDHSDNDAHPHVKVHRSSEVAADGQVPHNKVDNLYLYNFTIGEPTLCHVGITMSPFFFLIAETNAAAVAGVWSNSTSLPSVEVQREWIEKRLRERDTAFQHFDEDQVRDYIDFLRTFAPRNRVRILDLIPKSIVKNNKEILRRKFYRNVGIDAGESSQKIPSLTEEGP